MPASVSGIGRIIGQTGTTKNNLVIAGLLGVAAIGLFFVIRRDLKRGRR